MRPTRTEPLTQTTHRKTTAHGKLFIIAMLVDRA
jgi:hypothetical protein